jgi:hypothetical protein
MNVQDFKRWHWIAISIVVGLALSYVWSNVEWDENLPTIGQRDFEAGLTTPFPQVGHLDHITIMPSEEGKNKIIAEQVRNTKTPGVIELRPVAYMADAPYKAGAWRGGDESYPTVVNYLESVKAQNSNLSYKVAWWRQPWAVYLLWTGASVLLIGGVWPVLVSVMVGAGFGLKREEQGPEYDLERFKAEQDAKGVKHEPTPAEIAHLRELEDELERKLAAQRAGMPIPEDEPVAAQAAAVKKLDGGPLEVANTDKPAEDHDYKGEFYPVDRHAKRKT